MDAGEDESADGPAVRDERYGTREAVELLAVCLVLSLFGLKFVADGHSAAAAAATRIQACMRPHAHAHECTH